MSEIQEEPKEEEKPNKRFSLEAKSEQEECKRHGIKIAK